MPTNELSEAFEQAWAPFRDAVAQADFDRTTSAGWTVKEMLSHVAFWDETTAVVIPMIVRGTGEMPADWPGFASGYEAPEDGSWPHFDEHNAREAAWARGQSAEAVVERLDAAHAQALAALEALAPDEVASERFRQYVVDEKTGHYDQHLRELTE